MGEAAEIESVETEGAETQQIADDIPESLEEVEETTEEEVTEEEAAEAPAFDLSPFLKDKKLKVNGKEEDVPEIKDTEQLLAMMQKARAFDFANRDKSALSEQHQKLQTQFDELNNKYSSVSSNPEEYAKENPAKFEAFLEDFAWKKYFENNPNTTEEMRAEYDRNKALRDAEMIKQENDSLKTQNQERQETEHQKQVNQQHLNQYAQMATQGVGQHEHLKHVQSNPLVHNAFLTNLRAAVRNKISTTPERIANHTFKDTFEGLVVPLLTNLPMEFLDKNLDFYSKRLDDHRKSLVVNPNKPTPKQGERQRPVAAPKGKHQGEVWEEMLGV